MLEIKKDRAAAQVEDGTPQLPNRRDFIALGSVAMFVGINLWRSPSVEPAIISEGDLVANPQRYTKETFVCTGTVTYLGKRSVGVLVGGFPRSSTQVASGVSAPISEVMAEVDVFRFGAGRGIQAFRNIDTLAGALCSSSSDVAERIQSLTDGMLCQVTGRVCVRGPDHEPFLIFTSIKSVYSVFQKS